MAPPVNNNPHQPGVREGGGGEPVQQQGSLLSRAVTKIADGLLPRSPVSGKRCFLPIPHLFDKLMGEVFFVRHKANALRSIKVLELPADHAPERVMRSEGADLDTFRRTRQLNAAASVQAVFRRLQPVTPQWPKSVWDIIPWGENNWAWELHVQRSEECNAFAVPGGKIVVFEGILTEIWDRIRTKQRAIQAGETWKMPVQVMNAFGQTQNVDLDLSTVKYEDVVAALVGHEMTHVAARHGAGGIVLGLLISAFLGLVEILQARKDQWQSVQGAAVLVALFSLVAGMFDQITGWLLLWRSRANEFEADRFGMKLAHDAGFNPLGAVALQQLFADIQPEETWITRLLSRRSTHPLATHRVQALAAELRKKYQDVYRIATQPDRPEGGPPAEEVALEPEQEAV